jgi:diacylglycerol O-acyltransferase / wax synthase
VSLGTDIADPLARLGHIKAATGAMKQTMGSLKSILPTDFPSLGVPWLMEAATALYGKSRVAEKMPLVANVVISNVPGPPIALYMAGGQMLTNYPTSIVVHGMALNITVQSYDRSLDFGLMADAAAMPDVRELADAIRVSLDDLRALPRPGDMQEAPSVADVVAKAGKRAAGGLSKSVTGLVGQVARKVVGTAVEGAVAQVTSKVGSKLIGRAKKASSARASAPVKPRGGG